MIIDGATIALGGLAMTSLITMGKMMINYGRDRKELNGTVDRVKDIAAKLDKHISDEDDQYQELRDVIVEVKTKVDLLVDHKIKET